MDFAWPATRVKSKPAQQIDSVYTWIVRVIKDGVEGGSGSSASKGKFKVLDEEKIKQLSRLKASQSHLALGIFYAREGMIAEAEREFQSENMGKIFSMLAASGWL